MAFHLPYWTFPVKWTNFNKFLFFILPAYTLRVDRMLLDRSQVSVVLSDNRQSCKAGTSHSILLYVCICVGKGDCSHLGSEGRWTTSSTPPIPLLGQCRSESQQPVTFLLKMSLFIFPGRKQPVSGPAEKRLPPEFVKGLLASESVPAPPRLPGATGCSLNTSLCSIIKTRGRSVQSKYMLVGSMCLSLTPRHVIPASPPISSSWSTPILLSLAVINTRVQIFFLWR